MYLTSVEIENVRGFLDGPAKTVIALSGKPGWHVFAGRNGSGKSTLLRAIAIAIVGPDHARRLAPSFGGWVRKGASSAAVRVKMTRSKADDDYRGGGKLPKDEVAAELRWDVTPTGGEPVLTCKPQRQTKLTGPWRGPWAENPGGWLVAGYGPFRRLTGHGVEAQRSMTGPDHERRLVTLFREDASLLEATSWLQDLQFRKLEGRLGAAEALDNVLALLNDGLLPDDARVERVDSDGLWVQRAGSELELRDLSDGYRVALAFVIDILRHMSGAFDKVRIVRLKDGKWSVDNSAVVLIDEADAHLHVAWQQRIGFWLSERFPKVQFLVTTHSPFTCQAAAKDGLFSLAGPGERRGIEPVDELTYKKVVNGTADQAVLSALFGMDHVRSDRAEELTKEWSLLRAKLARAKLSKNEAARMRALEDQLPLPFDRTAGA